MPDNTHPDTVFLLGTTGYIGGSILQALLHLPAPPSRITCLVRSSEKARLLGTIALPRNTELIPLVGSLDREEDHEKIAQAAAESLVVINAATSDYGDWLKGVFKGMKRRRTTTGQRGIMIHTTGTGMFADDAMGMYEGDKVYTDKWTPDSPYLPISSIPPTARHVALNQRMIALDEDEDICDTYIVAPCHVWDCAVGELFDKGISHDRTIAFPWQVEESLKAGQSILTGKGLNKWDHVHIKDTASLFALIYSLSTSTDPPSTLVHGREGYYLARTGSYASLDIGQAIAEEMAKLGLTGTTDIKSFPHEDKRYRVGFSGTNARGVGVRAREIGWEPKHGELENLLAYVKREVGILADKMGKGESENRPRHMFA